MPWGIPDMPGKMFWLVSVLLGLVLELAGSERGSAANVMNYGADGNDYISTTSFFRIRMP
jgi:hypothetical protein